MITSGGYLPIKYSSDGTNYSATRDDIQANSPSREHGRSLITTSARPDESTVNYWNLVDIFHRQPLECLPRPMATQLEMEMALNRTVAFVGTWGQWKPFPLSNRIAALSPNWLDFFWNIFEKLSTSARDSANRPLDGSHKLPFRSADDSNFVCCVDQAPRTLAR